MKIENLPFGLTQWDQIEETIHPGEQGACDLANREVQRYPGADGGLFTGLCRRSLVHQRPYPALPVG